MQKKNVIFFKFALVQGFCPPKIKITQFPDRFRHKAFELAILWARFPPLSPGPPCLGGGGGGAGGEHRLISQTAAGN